MAIWKHTFDLWERAALFGAQRGQDAYIVCGGPSLAAAAHLQLSGPGRVVIGLNNTYPAIRPDIWIGMDEPDCYDRALLAESFPKIYRGNYSAIETPLGELKDTPSAHFMDVAEGVPFLPVQADQRFTWLHHTLGCAIQLAVWLGCETLHLLGCDLSHARGDYADPTQTLTEEQRRYNARLHGQQLAWLRDLRPLLRRHSVRLLSCSPESRLNEFFPFLPVAAALQASAWHLPSGRLKNHVLAQTP